MKSYQIFALLVAATVSASTRMSFYARMNGVLEPLSYGFDEAHEYAILAINDNEYPLAPSFDVSEGIVSIGEGPNKIFLSIQNDYLVFDKNLKPVVAELDYISRFVTENTYVCRDEVSDGRGFISLGLRHTKNSRCHFVDVYLLRTDVTKEKLKKLEVEKEKSVYFDPYKQKSRYEPGHPPIGGYF